MILSEQASFQNGSLKKEIVLPFGQPAGIYFVRVTSEDVIIGVEKLVNE